MAAYFLDNIPTDGVVPWDFNAPLDPPRPADSSAAMIAANGLLLLARREESLYPANQIGASYIVLYQRSNQGSLVRMSTVFVLNTSW